MDARDDGARLAALSGRLSLLLAHLTGPALRAHVDLDDLQQELWLRLLARPAGLPPPEPGDAGLWRLAVHVARHVVVDAARAARAARRGGGARALRITLADATRTSGSGVRPAAAGAGPATCAAGGEAGERLARAFAGLAAEHRRVLGLRWLEGLSAAQAAQRLRRSEAAVHSLYRRALLAWEQAARAAGAEFPDGRDESVPGPRLEGA